MGQSAILRPAGALLLLLGAMAGLPKGSASFARYGFMTREPGLVVSSSVIFIKPLGNVLVSM